MKNLIITALVSILHLGCSQLQAQEKPMNTFKKAIGNWSGIAEQTDQNGHFKLKQTEEIKFEQNKNLLVVKGKGRNFETDSLEFQAYGVMHFDNQANKYKFSAYTNGRYVLADVQLTEKGFDWYFDTPNGGQIYYSVELTDNKWIEDGKYSGDGTNWYPFFHMELDKVDN